MYPYLERVVMLFGFKSNTSQIVQTFQSPPKMENILIFFSVICSDCGYYRTWFFFVSLYGFKG